MPQTDAIIIGSGIAAFSAAYYLANKKVTIITKSTWSKSNSMLAQGGIASAVHENDSWKNHLEDTLIAGCHHNDVNNVKHLVQEGPSEILKWCQRGMAFDKNSLGELLLGKEGAHSQHRILHAGGDATGRELTSFLYETVKSSVTIVENEMVTDLIIKDGRCLGVYTKDDEGHVTAYPASKTVLASGGCGAVYGHTSNADVITGDGIAMAYRAGAEITDMEFIQFHPTMLYVNGRCVGLISEAVRGEGAILINQQGEAFMRAVHHQQDLAPRDVVSRAIYEEVKQGNKVYLDITNILNFEKRFPTVSKICKDNGIDVKSGKIPVAPGMHFLMGGIRTNDKGETSIKDLYAVGETACTGVHGANRLASNSLLEGIVFGKRLAEYLLTLPFEKIKNFEYDTTSITENKRILELPTKVKIQEMMTAYAGIKRTKLELTQAINWFEMFHQSFGDINVKGFTREQIEIINLLTIGWLITTSALKRTESRGGHYRNDYPIANDQEWKQKQIIRTKDEMYVGV